MFLFFCAIFAIIALRLVMIQVINGPTYAAEAEINRTNDITLLSRRGTIYDRQGNVLAMSTDCKTIYCNPKEVADADKMADLLVESLGGVASDYTDLLTRDSTFVYIKRKVDSSVADELAAKMTDDKLTGVYMLDDTKRIYPYGAVAGQVLGVVGVDGHGLTGLELQYDDILNGTDGSMLTETGLDGTPIAGGASKIEPAKNGTDIIISLDIDIQQVAEEAISAGTVDYQAESGFVMATDPSTGEILACCSTPLLDPQNTATADAASFTLKTISSIYEPGSIFKILTMSIGIDAGLISDSTTFTVPASVKVGDDSVTDDDGRDYTMEMSTREILRRSSNVGAVLVSNSLGVDVFSKGMEKFGIGTLTGVDYPGEVAGIVKSPEEYTTTTSGTMSFGQGVAVPMDQVVRAVGAVANKGIANTPHFLVSKDGQEVDWGSGTQVISEQTAATVTDMMRTVVSEGTAENAQVEGYDIAGKTGTGEQPSEEGGYKKYSYLSSLVGFAPASDASVLLYVGLDGTGYLASGSAARVFSTIMSEALTDMNIQPTN